MWFRLYTYVILFLYLISMFPWFSWNMPMIWFTVMGFIGSVWFYIFNRKKYFSINRKNVLPLLLLVLSFLLYAKGFSVFGMVEQLMVFVCIALVINLRDEYKVEVIVFLTKSMAWVVGVSLVFYILNLFGVPLQSSDIPVSKLGYTGTNYYLFTVPNELTNVFRFRSIFAEPGHLTMGIVPLLFLNKLNLRNPYVLVLMIAELFTISLAGLAAVFITLLMFGFSKQVKRTRYWISVLLISISSFVVVISLSEESVLYSALVSRLMFDDSKGTIAGNNRTDENADYFFSSYIQTPTALWGLGHEAGGVIVQGNAGYKVYIIRFGVLSALLAFMLYLLYALSYRSYEVMCFFILIMIMLFQNAYPFWFAVAFSYFLGIPYLNVINQPATEEELPEI